MTPIELPFSLPGFEVDKVGERDNLIEVIAHSVTDEVICPTCQQRSRRVHSYYQRSPTDLPVSDRSVRLYLTVKRFRCQTPGCSRGTFVERLPDLVTPYAQRTERLTAALGAIAFALGGQAGSRLAAKLSMPTSGDTLLRVIRRMPDPATDEPEVIGVDDWAKRRGRVYGTLLVDLERRRVIDLLADRTAETLAEWLKAHTRVKTVARDRSSEYARGIALGAPQAQQVADRWHLLVNLREAFERLLDRLRPELQTRQPAKTPEKTGEIPLLRRRHRSWQEVAARDGRRTRRLALHEKVHRLRRAGCDIRAIARHLSLSRTSVYKYLSMSRLPERAARQRQPSILDPYVSYLTQRWQAGCRNASQLWREIREKGYPGTHRQVLRWAYERRERPSPNTPAEYLDQSARTRKQLLTLAEAADKAPLPVSRRLVWLFLKHTDQLEPEERTLRDHLLTHPVLVTAKKLAQDFQRMVRERKCRAMDAWLKACETAAIPELVNFAIGLRQDYSAVKTALSSTWSNGQTEGHVNRLKLLKRQMYGRAHFDLLRLRCLHPT